MMLKTLCINKDGTYHDYGFEVLQDGAGSVLPYEDGKRYAPVGHIHNRMLYMEIDDELEADDNLPLLSSSSQEDRGSNR